MPTVMRIPYSLILELLLLIMRLPKKLGGIVETDAITSPANGLAKRWVVQK